MENPNNSASRGMESMQGYIKLPRRILDGEIASRPQSLALLVHLLIRANREPKNWHGVRIDRGQFVTSRRSLSKSCGLSEHQVRTALQFLSLQGLTQVFAQVHAHPDQKGAAHLAAPVFTIVTVCNYDSYDGTIDASRPSPRPNQNADVAQVPAQKKATTKEDKNLKFLSIVEKEDPRFLEPVRIWLEYKKEKRESLTESGFRTLWKRIQRESGGDPARAMEAVEYSMEVPYKRLCFPDCSKTRAKRPDTRGRTDIPDYDPNNFKSTLL